MGADLLIPILLAVAALGGVTFAVSFLVAFPKLSQRVHKWIVILSGVVCIACIAAAVWVGLSKKKDVVAPAPAANSTVIAPAPVVGNAVAPAPQADNRQRSMTAPAPAPPTQEAKREPAQAPQAEPQAFWPVVGCAFPQGVPSDITAYSQMSRQDFAAEVNRLSGKLVAFERDRNRQLAAAAGSQGDAASRQAAIDDASGKSLAAFRAGLLVDSRPVVTELYVRLKRPYPTSTADGVSVGGFSVICGGQIRDQTALGDLASYLRSLASELPA